jgi:peptidoglycan hydrolase-like protein with peptidoglycan-binding domain
VNTSLIGEYELNPELAPGPTAESAKPPAAPVETLADPRQAQENLMWESAQHSNLGADYQAYLSAFPGGVFAQMAKNRIASMESARTSAPTAAPQTFAMTEPTGPKADELKDNLGTADTERTLNLSPAVEKEVQQRLTALDFYKGPATGALDPATRSALAEWQKKSGFAPTSFLDSDQFAALKADSETEYQKYLAAQPASQPAAAEAPRRALARPSPKAPVVRAAKPPAPATLHRRTVKRTRPSRNETADQPGPASPFADQGGSPAWRHAAGLPELPTDPGLGGLPPGFWTGSSGGLFLGGFRHH